MSNVPSADSAPGFGAILRQRFPALGWIGKFDDFAYSVERTLVTIAMLVMSGVVCINVLFQFLAKQRAVYDRIGTTSSWGDLWPVVAMIACVALVARGAWARAESCRNNAPVVAVLTVITTLGFALACLALLSLPSHTLIPLLLLAIGGWVALSELDRPVPLGDAAVASATKVRVALTLVLTVAAAVFAAKVVPERYSWTSKLALFLLLWTAFIGASMATHDGRHLTIDAVRKALGPTKLPWYQGVSHLLAAVFTAGFAYLAWIYLLDRLAEDAAPNEIPDWLKVLAIPFSMGLVTIRFFGQSVAAFAVAALGLAKDAGGDA